MSDNPILSTFRLSVEPGKRSVHRSRDGLVAASLEVGRHHVHQPPRAVRITGGLPASGVSHQMVRINVKICKPGVGGVVHRQAPGFRNGYGSHLCVPFKRHHTGERSAKHGRLRGLATVQVVGHHDAGSCVRVVHASRLLDPLAEVSVLVDQDVQPVRTATGHLDHSLPVAEESH